MKALVKILIPVYKAPSEEELRSFRQCLSVLHAYPIVMVTHQQADVSVYTAVLQESGVGYSYQYFDESYFNSITAYSCLLLERKFYERFLDAEYIFIYQLDGFVFRDELKDWCQREFDYIGAPWFRHYGTHEAGNKLYKVGNGGVSLRKVAAFIRIFDQPLCLPVYSFYVRNIRKKGFFRVCYKTLEMFFLLLFTKRSVEYYLQHYTDPRINEDCFWADALSSAPFALKVPDVKTAALFCMEKSPSYLFHLSGEKIPFACHAYEKYEYEIFWKKWICSCN